MLKDSEIEISVVIPVFNSVETLSNITNRLLETFEKMDIHSEIIFVDDGSKNKETWPTLEHLAESHPNVIAISLMRNFGQHAATICGLKQAKGQYIITMDDDLQHQPEDIPLLFEQNGHDVVIGMFPLVKQNLIKRFLSWIKGWFEVFIIGKPRGISVTSFKLINRNVVNGVLEIQTYSPILGALLYYVTNDVVNVAVSHKARKDGKSGYDFSKMLRLFSNLVITNSSLLLRCGGYIGLFTSLFSLIFSVIIVTRRLLGEEVIAGWTSTFAATLFIGG